MTWLKLASRREENCTLPPSTEFSQLRCDLISRSRISSDYWEVSKIFIFSVFVLTALSYSNFGEYSLNMNFFFVLFRQILKRRRPKIKFTAQDVLIQIVMWNIMKKVCLSINFQKMQAKSKRTIGPKFYHYLMNLIPASWGK